MAFVIVVPILFLVVTLLATRAKRLTDDIYTLKLAGCFLDYHTPAVALACPGVDYIRLWPLPVTQPWEEPTDEPGWVCEDTA